LPSSLGGATGAVSGLRITGSGLSFDQVSITLPNIKFGDGSKVMIKNLTATLTLPSGGYLLSISGTLALRLPDNSQDIPITASMDSNGNLSASISGSITLNIATASRGSDHLRSRPAIDLYHLPQEVLRKIYGSPVPYDGPLSSEHTEYIGKPWQVFWHENCYMGVDCLGICKYHTTFLGATLPNFEDWSKVLYYNTGLEMTPEEIWQVARRGNMVERLFNLREGLTREDLEKGDMLNHRYFDEPCRRGAIDVVGRVIDKEKFIKMIDELYEHKGLDQDGVPKPETLKSLGLDKEPSHLL